MWYVGEGVVKRRKDGGRAEDGKRWKWCRVVGMERWKGRLVMEVDWKLKRGGFRAVEIWRRRGMEDGGMRWKGWRVAC